MIKRLLIISLVAVIAYYAGAQGITPGNLVDWFEERKITQTIKTTIYKTLELVEDQQLVEKSENVIESLKEKVSN
jgi:Fe2+ or Zn2+ uptake regulation protein